jgi:SAM-dependent methyltransferase
MHAGLSRHYDHAECCGVHKISYWDHNWLILKQNNENVRRHLKKMSGVVYDLGCGTRPYERDIRAAAAEYIGVDWSNTYHVLQADIVADINQSLPVADCVANTVVSFQVLEHLHEPQMMLDEAFRILRNGGSIVLTVPFQWCVHEPPYDYYRYTRYGLEYMLAKAGFVDIDVHEVGGFWGMWFLKLNYQTARLVQGPTLLRSLIRVLLLPLWITDQFMAPLLDRYWPSPQEAVGYVAVARKE